MIIFYNNKTGDILGKIDGRVHDDHTINNVTMHYSNILDKDISKYLVPFKDNLVEEEEPIMELQVMAGTNKVKNVQVGTQKVMKAHGMVPDVPFSDLIYKFEKHQENIFSHKVVTDKDGQVKDIVKK